MVTFYHGSGCLKKVISSCFICLCSRFRLLANLSTIRVKIAVNKTSLNANNTPYYIVIDYFAVNETPALTAKYSLYSIVTIGYFAVNDISLSAKYLHLSIMRIYPFVVNEI